jgi:class 3 adenylate cyclase
MSLDIADMLDSSLRAKLALYLPADLLERLPERRAMSEAARQLSSLYKALSSFLAPYVAQSEKLLTEDTGGFREGSLLFADVSGFTALSEKLQAFDPKAGAEVMTKIINEYFTTMLEIMAKSDGQLLKFAGDALLIFFPGTLDHEEAPKAIRTGLRMQRAMREHFQPIQHSILQELIGEHDHELTMSVGIVRGNLFEAFVGNQSQRDHMIQGYLPGKADEAETVGTRDDVIVDIHLYEQLKNEFEMVPLTEGFYQVIDNLGDNLDDFEFALPQRRRAKTSAFFGIESKEDMLEDMEKQLRRVENVARFVSQEVVNKLVIKGTYLESENRPATVMFIHFTGFTEMLDAWGEEHVETVISILDRYFTIMQQVVATKGGSLNRSDPYKLGCKLLITFGAPVAHEDDPDRAVAAALEMNEQLALLNERLPDELPSEMHRPTFISQRIGITQGSVFAGEVGWRSRREYTVMGDDVNLAARLMSGAELGQIVINQRVWERVQRFFETRPLEPRRFKGKSEPVPIYEVVRQSRLLVDIEATSDTPFIGRDALLLTLTMALQQAKGPRRRRAIVLYGDAGIGKTRIAQKLAEDAASLDFNVGWVTCRSQDSRKSTWASLISQLLNLEEKQTPLEKLHFIEDVLENMGIPEIIGGLSELLEDFLLQKEEAKPVVEARISDLDGIELEEVEADEFDDDIFAMVAEQDRGRPSGLFRLASGILTSSNSGELRGLWQDAAARTSNKEAVVRFLQKFAMKQPTLLIVDDAHRINRQALDILQTVIAKIKIAKLVILVAYEPDVELDLGVQAMAVQDLVEAETGIMGARILGAGELDPKLLAFLWRRTSGRPLFIESLLRALQDEGQIVIDQGVATLREGFDAEALPDDVRQLVISRIDRLSVEAQQVLRAASVWDGGFTADILPAIDASCETYPVDEILGELTHKQILRQDDEAGIFYFQHGVTQITVYESMNRFQRQKLHRAAADYLQKSDDAMRYILNIAYHQVKGGVPMRAIELITTAASEAESNNAMEQAIELYTRGLEIFPSDESMRVQLQRLQETHRKMSA